jgi:polysaccharide transporter, PST family
LTLISFGGAGLFSLVAVTSTDVVVLLLGSKWAAAGPLLCLFALRGIPQSVERTIGWLHVAAGRPDRWSRWGLVSAAVQLAALAIGLQFGVVGVCVAYAIALALLFVPAVAYAGAPLGIHARDVLAAAGPQVAAGFLTVAVGLTVQSIWLDGWTIWPRVLTAGLLSVTVYLTLVFAVFRVMAPLRLLAALARDLAERRSGNIVSRWTSARKSSP